MGLNGEKCVVVHFGKSNGLCRVRVQFIPNQQLIFQVSLTFHWKKGCAAFRIVSVFYDTEA